MKKRKVKTHTINGVIYSIKEATKIYGVCDIEGDLYL